ncbi:MAG: sigma 54-interacting transcriptional regulator [Myxococcota bacterium]
MTGRSRNATPLVLPSVGGRRTRVEKPRWFLRVVAGPDGEVPVEDHEITARETRVGRQDDLAPPAGLRLDDHAASRVHATLRRSPDGRTLELIDEGSTNGTWVGGRRVERVVLRDGDVVRMAGSVLLVGRSPLAPPEGDDLGLLGRTPAIARLRRLVRRAAPSDLPVLVMGPTGTGKELVAEALHGLAGRTGEHVTVNCGALPGTLVEDALFGHVKGAFTDAQSDEPGAFVRAHDGTLFLDEVGELPLEDQPKLLRALETGDVTPVGATRSRHVDVRVVAATNRPLLEAVDEGRFRDDLYARLAGIVLETPPLSARREDILPLFRHFLPEDIRHLPVTPDFVEALLLYPWPRNVRELRRLAERLGVLHPDADHLEPGMLDAEMHDAVDRLAEEAAPQTAPEELWPPSRERLVELLERAGGNVSKVAERVGRNRKQVYRWMDKLGVARGAGR